MNTWQNRATGIAVALAGLFLAVAAFAVALAWSAAPQATVSQPSVPPPRADGAPGHRQETGETRTAENGMEAKLFGSKPLGGGVAGGTRDDIAQPRERESILEDLPAMSGLGDPLRVPEDGD